jgi:hypothetical protein
MLRIHSVMLSALALSAGAAQAQFPEGKRVRILSVEYGQALNSPAVKSNDIYVFVGRYREEADYHWTIAKAGDYYTLKHENSGKLLSVLDKSKDQGEKLACRDTDGSKEQKWIIDKVGKHYRIKSVYNGLVLDVKKESPFEDQSRHVVQWGFHGEDNQLWEIVEVK